ncbi:MAG: class I SAM-dependent methyltransferase [bacterium]|nr:class I SAM-dependent methyltransferase [bacterium]
MPSRGLYNWLHENYDRLIQWPDRLQRELPGLMLWLPEPEAGAVLDLGCGTGGHMAALLERGYKVHGIDLSEKLIQVAKEKLSSWNPPLEVGDIVDGVPKNWKKFSVQLCLGNTLSHLSAQQAITFAQNSYQRAKEDGILIIENRNWDRLLTVKERLLKPVQTDDSIYIRMLDYPPIDGNPVVMTVALWQKGKWQTSSVDLWPHRAKELNTIFQNAGWTLDRACANLLGQPFDGATATDWVAIWRRA